MSLAEKARMKEERNRKLNWMRVQDELGIDRQWVPSNVSIKRNRVGNVDDDRLYRRRGRLVWLIRTNARSFPNRIDFVMKAAELQAIEEELVRRNKITVASRYTRTKESK